MNERLFWIVSIVVCCVWCVQACAPIPPSELKAETKEERRLIEMTKEPPSTVDASSHQVEKTTAPDMRMTTDTGTIRESKTTSEEQEKHSRTKDGVKEPDRGIVRENFREAPTERTENVENPMVQDGGASRIEPRPDELMVENTAAESTVESSTESRPEVSQDSNPSCKTATPNHISKQWVSIQGEGSGFVFVKDMRVDPKGFLYLCGSITGGRSAFPKASLTALSGASQMYVVKLNAAGQFVWLTSFAGVGSRDCQGLALGSRGDIFITGGFTGSIRLGTQTLNAKGMDVYVARIDPCGMLKWVSQGGGASADMGQSIGVDAKGAVYVYGQFNGPATFGNQRIYSRDLSSVFVAKLDANGRFQWVAKGGSAAPDTPAGIAVTPQGDSYIAGSSFMSVTFGSFKLGSQHPFELFVTKLNTQGKFVWAKQTKGTGRIIPYRVGLDPAGHLYITGEVDGSKKFGSLQLVSPAHGDIFLLQMGAHGTFNWVLRPKGSSHLHPFGLGFGGNEVYLAGDYTGAPSFGTTQFPTAHLTSSFVARASKKPGFTWATRTKGNGELRAQAMAVGPKGNLFVAGNIQSSGSFGNVHVKIKPASYAIFVWKLPKP